MISPTARYLRFAAGLRELRAERGMNIVQLAAASGVQRQKISMLENAHEKPNMLQVTKLLKALEASTNQWRALAAAANDATLTGWWYAYPDMGERQATYADLECGAVNIREFHNILIPGLLQTKDYNRARARETARVRTDERPTDIEASVEARKARQDMVRGDGGATYDLVIEEAALRRPSAPPDVMADQLRYLVSLREAEPRVTIRVLPTRAAIQSYWVPRGTFTLYTYPDPGDPVVACVDTEAADLVHAEPQAVRSYVRQFERFSAVAMTVEDSVTFMGNLAEEFANESPAGRKA